MDSKKDFKKYLLSRNIGSSISDSFISSVENMTRSVIEERSTNFREIDVFSRLIMDRIVFIGGEIDDYMSNILVAQLLFLCSQDNTPISIYINSPGGSVHSGLAIYDTMQYVDVTIRTMCVGLAASMGAVLLAGGSPNLRYALPHSRIMIHQPLGGVKGQASDIVITANEITKIKEELNQILATKTGQTLDKIYKDTDRDFYMTAQEALEYGIIDEIITK